MKNIVNTVQYILGVESEIEKAKFASSFFFGSVEGGGEGLEQKSLDYFSVSKVALSSLSAFEKIVDIDATGECVFYSSQFEKIGLSYNNSFIAGNISTECTEWTPTF